MLETNLKHLKTKQEIECATLQLISEADNQNLRLFHLSPYAGLRTRTAVDHLSGIVPHHMRYEETLGNGFLETAL